jgi:hypothetical protein
MKKTYFVNLVRDLIIKFTFDEKDISTDASKGSSKGARMVRRKVRFAQLSTTIILFISCKLLDEIISEVIFSIVANYMSRLL